MDVILHLGAHRTASTGLQALMARAARGPAQGDLVYWGPDETRSGLFDGLFAPPGGPVWTRRAARPAGRLAIRAAQAEAAGARVLLVSDVRLLGPLDRMPQDARLYPSAGSRVLRVAQGFGGHRLTLALSIRCYDAWWASVLAHRLLRDGALPPGDLCDRLVTQPTRWRHVIAGLARAIPEARLVVWTHEAMGGRPADVLHALTGQRPARGDMQVCGSSGTGPCGADMAAMRRRIEAGGGDPAWMTGGRFMPFDTYHRAALRAQYDEDLAWLSAGAGGLAQYINEPAPQTRAETDEGRGLSNDPEPQITRPRRVAPARRDGVERPRPR